MNILDYRTKHGLSQQDFADLISLHGKPATQGLISQYETGEVKVTADRAIQFDLATNGEIPKSHYRPDYWPVTENAA